MNQLRASAAIVLSMLLLLFGQALSLPMPVAASEGEAPSVPTAIAVPAGSVLLFSRHARGVQIYECKSGQWALHAPRAVLFDPDAHKADGIHYGGVDRDLPLGPWWESKKDGSRIRGGNPVAAPSPNPNSIPQLRLDVVEHRDSGEFTPVTHIQRLNTFGGISPTGACQTGAQRDVPSPADYYFYAAP